MKKKEEGRAGGGAEEEYERPNLGGSNGSLFLCGNTFDPDPGPGFRGTRSRNVCNASSLFSAANHRGRSLLMVLTRQASWTN